MPLDYPWVRPNICDRPSLIHPVRYFTQTAVDHERNSARPLSKYRLGRIERTREIARICAIEANLSQMSRDLLSLSTAYG